MNHFEKKKKKNQLPIEIRDMKYVSMHACMYARERVREMNARDAHEYMTYHIMMTYMHDEMS